MTEKLSMDWFEERESSLERGVEERGHMRTVANNVILHLHPTRVPAEALRFTYTWGLGGISTVLAVMLVLTGLLLMFRYDADIERAYTSIQILETQVVFGSLIRAIHHWSANLLVVTVFLHLVRVFYTAAFKKGRAVNWLVGLALFLIVLAFNFTGYLLPWDQLSYWAITVSTSLFDYIPTVGSAIGHFFTAGPQVGQGALRNFYAIHVALLPVLLAITMTYHFWKLRKNGGISVPERPQCQPVERVTTIPNLIQIEFAVLAVVVVGVVIWAMLVPAPLGEMANPARSPNPAKAAWYFSGLQELLLHMDALSAILLVGIVLVGIAMLPLLDCSSADIGLYFRSNIGRKAALLGAFLSLDLVPLLVIGDEYWFDLPALIPGLPSFIANGLIPLLVILLILTLVYFAARAGFKANHSEALTGVFTFIIVSLVILTVVGVYFRGPNMALVLPF